ncbi:insulin-like growth factor-binding protein 1a [Amia ocellicauda]|uniref:insulin-like growth factor-binding protein 1a n=1 Tax=Amia ocellicauda TaxID=2972642 RepID=UPI003464D308
MRGLLSLRYPGVAAVAQVLLALSQGSPLHAPEPLVCAPCTADTLLQCPAVAPDCAEVLKEPGCGCCYACALQKGALCGVYTARCGTGLRCHPQLGEQRPLHALIRGHAVCMEPSEAARIQAVQAAENENAKNMAVDRDQVSLQYRLGHVTHSKPFEPREATEAQESMKANINANRKKLMEQGPCQVDLHRALEKITKSQQKTKFYLPNCDKHGFYNPKQCETSLESQRGKCWCVTPWNGKMIAGSLDLPGEMDCQQYPSLVGQE